LGGPYSISKSGSHAQVAIVCLSYLNFTYFDSNISDDAVDEIIATGGYVLHDYAQANFLYHIESAWRDPDTTELLAIPIREFLELRWNPSFRPLNVQLPPASSSITLGQMESKFPEEYRKLIIIVAHLESQTAMKVIPDSSSEGQSLLCRSIT
jgi:hypothetical protein